MSDKEYHAEQLNMILNGDTKSPAFAWWRFGRVIGKAAQGRIDRHNGRVTYISGPMTGIPEYNFPMFEHITKALRSAGEKVFSPHEVVHPDNGELGSLPWEEYIRKDLQMMLDNCNAILLLPGWRLSKGATFERLVAVKLNFEVYELQEDGVVTILSEKIT